MVVSNHTTSPTCVRGRTGTTHADITTNIPLLPTNLHCVLITIYENSFFGWSVSQFIRGARQLSAPQCGDRQHADGKHFHRSPPARHVYIRRVTLHESGFQVTPITRMGVCGAAAQRRQASSGARRVRTSALPRFRQGRIRCCAELPLDRVDVAQHPKIAAPPARSVFATTWPSSRHYRAVSCADREEQRPAVRSLPSRWQGKILPCRLSPVTPPGHHNYLIDMADSPTNLVRLVA
jgi:hypothetical protein